ncbi:GNAT family N-acetyltransferase [uncultured Campylobacter sp.]|uniref:GNAT family N-acetyltransferase n=1 Tax=uncultured Campylobacter sp. TaxID=218934 RepID=UPI0026049F99|nr:GNAT family N-acetyltransferase [uncultured Campylobacter sp.]
MTKNVFLIDEQDGIFYNSIADYMDQRDYLGVGSSFCSEQNRYLTAKNLENLTVGFLAYTVFKYKEGDVVYINYIYVRSDFRLKGAMRSLLEKLYEIKSQKYKDEIHNFLYILLPANDNLSAIYKRLHFLEQDEFLEQIIIELNLDKLYKDSKSFMYKRN